MSSFKLMLFINYSFIFLLINIITTTITFPLDSKEINIKEIKLNNKKWNNNENQLIQQYKQYYGHNAINSTSRSDNSSDNNNYVNSQRQREIIMDFMIEILKGLEKVTYGEVKHKIQEYLINNKRINSTTIILPISSTIVERKSSENKKLRQLIKKEFEQFEEEIRRARRQNSESEKNDSQQKVESDSDESDSDEDAPPSGIAGIIASLSGGDEGSDVGALIGALSTGLTNLFGPGGIDVGPLLATATSLTAGLLGGDENFGKTISGFIGSAIDGLTGGGGADNNGLFFGNFLGGLLAQLSANPEDDALPPKPFVFLQNFKNGFHQARRNQPSTPENKEGEGGESVGGSNSFSFITHIVSSIVAGITSLIVNTSLGSSSGSSQGSVDASASSSGHPDSHPKMN